MAITNCPFAVCGHYDELLALFEVFQCEMMVSTSRLSIKLITFRLVFMRGFGIDKNHISMYLRTISNK